MKKIHVIAPSGANPDQKSPLGAIEWFKRQGFEVQNTDCIERRHQRFSGVDAERLAEINQISKLSGDHLVLAMRGGYGLHRLLPDIEWQHIANAIQKGLQVCGHSDFTVFQLGLLAKTGAVSLAGPMLNYDFGSKEDQSDANPDGFMWQHFQAAIQDRELDCTVEAQQAYLGRSTAGELTGTLWGGNLTILCSLMGTPYFPAPKQIQGGILFLEDVNEHPYRIERNLMQLLDAGILSSQSAILMGGFSAYRLFDHDQGYDLNAVYEHLRKRLPENIPLLTDLPFGHQANKITLPVGASGKLSYKPSGFILQSKW